MPGLRSRATRLLTTVSWLLALLVAMPVAAGIASAARGDGDGGGPAAVAAPTVHGSFPALLLPGAPAGTADVVLGNPGEQPLTVDSLVTGQPTTSSESCPSSALVLPSGPLLAAPVTVPAGGRVVVSVPAPALAADAPAGCIGVSVSVTVTATAIGA